LTRLAREELEHFELLLDHLRRRGIPLRRQSPSPYAALLLKAVRCEEPGRAIDTLLCLSLIEARSCERMKLLADALDDADLRALYASLLASEARHHHSYAELAALVAPAHDVRERLRELARHEAAVLAAVPPMPRMHG
jgi:tRNA-(ms[2]io[6]A)-hydroxylase